MSLPWSMIERSRRTPRAGPRRRRCRAAGATTGVPRGAPMSMPLWNSDRSPSPRRARLAEVRVHGPADRPARRQRGEDAAGLAEEALERAEALALPVTTVASRSSSSIDRRRPASGRLRAASRGRRCRCSDARGPALGPERLPDPVVEIPPAVDLPADRGDPLLEAVDQRLLGDQPGLERREGRPLGRERDVVPVEAPPATRSSPATPTTTDTSQRGAGSPDDPGPVGRRSTWTRWRPVTRRPPCLLTSGLQPPARRTRPAPLGGPDG